MGMENVNPNESVSKRRRVEDRTAKWARPPVKLEELKHLTFMQVDVDSYNDFPVQKFHCVSVNKVPVLRMYGVTEAGNSIMAHIHGFFPYFYVPCPAQFRDCDVFRESLDAAMSAVSMERGLDKYVIHVEIQKKSTIMMYQGPEHDFFFKVVVAIPNLVSAGRNLIERGFELSNSRGNFPPSTSYETNVPFPLRFMIDRKIVGGGWVELTEYDVRKEFKHKSTCQIEVDAHYNQLMCHDWISIAPIRILSFDIECYNQEGKGFPVAEKNPVIQIAAYLKEFGKDEKVCEAVWCVDTCADIPGIEVFSFEKEADMLLSFRDFIERVDPDLLTGYNICNFDLPYILGRAETLRINDFSRLGRLRGAQTKIREIQIAGRDVKEMTIEGRVQFDMLTVIQREHKLRSYSLNSVSATFLGDQKEDVHYSMIGELFTTSAETRRRLAVYCCKDARLPILLIDKLLCIYNYVEMARVTGTPINYLLTRGQMIKVQSQLLRKAQECDYLLPSIKTQASDDKFEGATVLEPVTGFYEDPIVTLDFASLYPSIMMAHNLCYCTLVPPDKVAQLPPSDLTRTPCGNHFIKTHSRRGLLPMILEELLSARKRAKKDMAEATDPLTKSVLNGRQLALKISANSVYGFTGATVGVLPCLEISSSVTAFGREMIDHTKKMVEERYCIKNGYATDAHVVYGDTDSVFIKFGPMSVEQAMKLGEEAAGHVSKTFLRPIKLEFEKVYWPYLLLNKKRYAGLYWTNHIKYDKLDTKGIETVRRDNCSLVTQVMETVLHKILIDKSIPAATEYVRTVIGQLLQNNIDLSMLVITKSLGKGANVEDYKTNSAHVCLAEKMRKRDPSTAPGSGDRVPYVIVTGAKGVQQYQRAEDPLYVLENNLQIDAKHYIEHQLQPPLMRIFGPILPDAQSMLFSGDHTRKVSNISSASGPMSMFVKKGLKCLGCKVVIQEGSLCKHCLANSAKAAEVVLESVGAVRSKEAEYSRLWTQCQRCQGSFHQEVICSNRDCEIFYRRTKVRRDMETAQATLSRLRLSDCAW